MVRSKLPRVQKSTVKKQPKKNKTPAASALIKTQDLLIKLFSNNTVLITFKILIGLVFVLSSVTKIFEPEEFSKAIGSYKMMPETVLFPLAVVIPWLQLICGILLLADVYAKSSAFILSGLLVVYTIAITQAWLRGFDMECGCFDLMIGLPDKVGIFAIIRDLVLLGMAGCIFLFDKDGLSFYGLFKNKKTI